MTCVVALSALVFMVAYVVVLADMAKRGAWWAVLGVFIFPVTLVWVLFGYSGRKVVVAPLLYVPLVAILAAVLIAHRNASESVAPFLAQVQDDVGLDCLYTGSFYWNSDLTIYHIQCFPETVSEVQYRDARTMVSRYQREFVEPLLSSYSTALGDQRHLGVDLGIRAPDSDLMACYKLRAPGLVEKAWHTGIKEPCGR